MSENAIALKPETELTAVEWEAIGILVAGKARNGLDAARQAGLPMGAARVAAWWRRPEVRAAVRQERMRVVSQEGAAMAVRTLMDVMDDPEASRGERVKAAGVMLLAAKDADAPDARDVAQAVEDLTLEQLERMVAERAARLRDVTGSATIPDQNGQTAGASY
jgi:hypothetical protein